MVTIDLNSDMGESFSRWELGDDPAMLQTVTSANIACGFHAGDASIMRATIQEAVRNNVTVGAHISYRDLPGFGRRFIDYDPRDLYAETIYQLGALDAIARTEGTRVAYVKPHGALGHAIIRDQAQARAVVEAVHAYSPELAMLLMPNSHAVDISRELGLRVVLEAFADRGYLADGNLVPRSRPGAMVHEPAAVIDNMLRFVETGTLTAIDGTVIDIEAASICVHSDTASSVQIARELKHALTESGVQIRSFVS